MFKRTLPFGWSAWLTVISFGLMVMQWSVSFVGTVDDIRSTQDPNWWEEAYSWFLTMPSWMSFAALILFAFIFTVQLAIDAHTANEALRTVKSSNEHAWAFEPEFREVSDRMEEKILEFNSALEAVQQRHKEIIAWQVKERERAREKETELARNLMNPVRQMCGRVEQTIKEEVSQAKAEIQQQIDLVSRDSDKIS